VDIPNGKARGSFSAPLLSVSNPRDPANYPQTYSYDPAGNLTIAGLSRDDMTKISTLGRRSSIHLTKHDSARDWGGRRVPSDERNVISSAARSRPFPVAVKESTGPSC